MARGDGDGWVVLDDGTRRWGRYGAAGLLLYGTDAAGRDRVLLQRRVWWSHQGGTWGVPGGARDSSESSMYAAVREFTEEVRAEQAGADWGPDELGRWLSPVGIHRQDHGRWSYDTVLARLPGCPPMHPGNGESSAVEWVTLDTVTDRTLHPGFAGVWPQLRGLLPARMVLVVDAVAPTASANGSTGNGAGHAGGPATLHRHLTTLASTGLAAEALPYEVGRWELRRWFPRVRLVVSGEQQPPPPQVPEVEVVSTPGGTPTDGFGAGAAAVVEAARVADATTVVVVTDDPQARQRCADAGAHVCSSAWLEWALPRHPAR
ncbi:NUDIX hydrolase [Lipingzhangella sp. LS1_29]|uniref:NUDIX hydrolase n=1 Tax=Lipingzhangella rawalii TaxID=2055835 RepID=A0ABU2H483_9ACTN|nr:NUDIX hydrolase [Lipingzhangella rawalii]MDS1269664.1 NUDIX hydrolase [Lipingzhangella rawalii]